MGMWTWETRWTGYRKMKDPKFLSEVQDKVWNDPRWKASIIGGFEVTHCNQSALAVANGVGCHEFDPPSGGEPYTADQLYYFFQRGSSNFLEKDLDDIQGLANAGSLVFAILPSWLLKEQHGHVVSVTPGDQVKSESLSRWVPVCLNVSTEVLSSRSIGINWAFPMKRVCPRFFAWKASL